MNQGAPNYPTTTLYVGNLHSDITEKMLFDKFSTVGSVLSIQMCRNLSTPRSLGYAYVDFLRAADAERALEMMNFDFIKNRPIRITWSQRDPSLRKSVIGNIFIKNLDSAIDDKTMYDTFSAFGKILSCKVAQYENGTGKGYGFIHFETEEAANKCIDKVNGMLFNGNKIYVGRFIRLKERKNGLGDSAKLFTNLYVKNFGEDLSEDQLRIMFEKYGKIISYKIMSGDDGKSKGFGFVTFESPEDADTAVEALNAERALEMMNFDFIKNRPIRITWSQRDPSLRKSVIGNIFIKNLDSAIDDKTMYDTFSAFGKILSCKVAQYENGTGKGYGFIHFETEEAANKCIDKVNGMLFNGNKIYVGRFIRLKERKNGLGDSAKLFTNLYVKNFGEDLSEDQLRIMFEKYGKIISYKIMSGDDGKSKGFGFVTFESPEDADTAVEALNGKEIMDGKPLYVGLVQQKDKRKQEVKRKFEKLKMERPNPYEGVNLYVKDIDNTIDDERLRKEFSQFGTIISAKVMMQEGKSRGFGFVCFSSPEEAAKAIRGMNGRIVSSKPIYVALAQRKEERKALLTSRYQNRQLMASATQISAKSRWLTQSPVRPGDQGGEAAHTEMPNTYRATTKPPQSAAMHSSINVTEPITGQRPPNMQGSPLTGQEVVTSARIRTTNFKYKANMRSSNQSLCMQGALAPVQHIQGKEPLTATMLAAALPKEQKQMLCVRLFPLIQNMYPDLAGKITDMLLEIDNMELLHMLEHSEYLKNKVEEAVAVFQGYHQAKQAAIQLKKG